LGEVIIRKSLKNGWQKPAHFSRHQTVDSEVEALTLSDVSEVVLWLDRSFCNLCEQVPTKRANRAVIGLELEEMIREISPEGKMIAKSVNRKRQANESSEMFKIKCPEITSTRR
jgi:hypothetical protein